MIIRLWKHLDYLWNRTDKFNKRIELEVQERVKLRKRLVQIEHWIHMHERRHENIFGAYTTIKKPNESPT